MDQTLLAKANNQFGLNLFKILRSETKGKNAFISPMSISAALSMTQLGAQGKTAKQMSEVLGWESENGEKIHKLFQAYITTLQVPSDKYKLSIANRIYLEQTFSVLEEFKGKTKQFYLAEPVQANFVQEAAQETVKINDWVAKQTENKIKDLLGPGVLNAMTRMVLINAIYFKGLWQTPFDAQRTSDMPFKLSNGQAVNVKMMFREELYGIYRDDDLNCTAVEILYKGGDLAMVIILPDKDNGLEELVDHLTADKLNTIVRNVAQDKSKIRFFLPRFEMTSTYMLKEPLSTLGMPEAFDDRADFSRMTGRPDLQISEVAHKAFVKVNEEGTEAAAATGIVMTLRCLSPTIAADHPFLFIITDARASNSILFLGQVENPLA